MHTNKLCLTLVDPIVYYDPVRVVKQQMGYMDIGDDLWFIAVCHCDHEAEQESEVKTSIDTQPDISIYAQLVATIDKEFEAPIDSEPANEIENFP